MDRLGVVGIGWQKGGPELLARFTLPREERAQHLNDLAEAIGTTEVVYIATCNRVEIAFSTGPETPVSEVRSRIFEALAKRPALPGEAERLWRAWAGEGAAEHLYLVTSGLDSARVGETDISGQIRQALEVSREAGLVGPRLNQVFDGALKAAAQVHQLTAVGEGRTSLAEVALDAVRDRLAQNPGKVALVGVSPMTRRCGVALADIGVPLLIVNRSIGPAEALAAELGGTALALKSFVEEPQPVEAIVSATGAPTAVLPRKTLSALAALSSRPLIVDMAVPPDIDPDDAAGEGLERLDMTQIIVRAEANRLERLSEMAEARIVVDQGLRELRRQMCDRLMAPLITELRRRSHDDADRHLKKLLKKDLPELTSTQEAAVRRWTHALVKRMIHTPTVGLRALAFEAGPLAVEAFLGGSQSDLAGTLSGIADKASHLGEAKEDV